MSASFSLHLVGSSGRLQQFMHQLPTAVLLVNQAGSIVEVNEQLLRVTGYSRDRLVNQPFQTILPFNGSVEQLYEELLQKEAQPEFNVEVEWKNKQGICGKTPAMILVQQAEQPLYLIHLSQLSKEPDFTLPQRVLTKLTHDTSLGLFILDEQANIVEASQTACKLLGMDRLQVINNHIDRVFAGIPEQHRLIKKELLEGVKLHNIATSWSNDNQRYELIVDANTLQDGTGKTVGAFVLFKDITNLRSFEQKIERNERLAMIGQIAAGTAHEIRNPLTSIKGFLQMFLKSFGESGMDREKTYTEIMLTEINRINSLVSEFLLLSKPRNIQYSMVDLNTVFSEILPIVESQAILYGIDVKFSSHGKLPMVVGDTELLKQVFINICKNGIEAMGEQGTLQISHHIDQDGDKVSIDIHDSGPGIPLYIIDKIFDPFFTTKEEGTGLGLSVCQKIIHDIGGQIRVSSKGYGTTFHIMLPYM
ncbi:PAS domain-containing sensor histidine kinase [Brevibacillus choshinensis]|uniref:histidine kinase n=1 Tax=Brevibacillus choshinensis TaxID=54911 RepID=A0ABX7FPU2_BRECH|nr:PAS domain-containing sensor histidine kinase [Brevibacillus choshinensis]QRG67763.1 PAS domain-containing protein [Brevibacillus choshinensis]